MRLMMPSIFKISCAAISLMCTLHVSAHAADVAAPKTQSQAPFGLAKVSVGAFQHDVNMIGSKVEKGQAVNVEAQWKSPDFLSLIGAPRPTLGAVAAFSSNTTQHAYAGLNWSSQHWWNTPFYIDGFFGLAVGNFNSDFDPKAYNRTHPTAQVNVNDYRKFVGSKVMFREAIEIGYRLGARQEHSISAIASHMSHGEILSNDSRNQGMDHYGVRYGYYF